MWNEAFEFPFLDPYQPIEISCYDEDPIANDLIGGTSEMQVNDLLFINGPRWIEVFYDGKPSGHMLLEAKLIDIKFDDFNPLEADGDAMVGKLWDSMIENEAGMKLKIRDFNEARALQTEPLGVLRIKVVKGILTKNTEIIGKMDPFVKLSYRGVKYTTFPHKEGGRNPQWNQIFEIPILQ